MMRVLGKLSAEAGSRLANFKALGGLLADGDLNLKEVGSFTPTWTDAGKLDTLRHNQSMTVKTPSAASQEAIDKSYKIVNNWSDLKAAFQKPPMQPVLLSSLSVKGEGFGSPTVHQNAKKFYEICLQAEQPSSSFCSSSSRHRCTFLLPSSGREATGGLRWLSMELCQRQFHSSNQC